MEKTGILSQEERKEGSCECSRTSNRTIEYEQSLLFLPARGKSPPMHTHTSLLCPLSACRSSTTRTPCPASSSCPSSRTASDQLIRLCLPQPPSERMKCGGVAAKLPQIPPKAARTAWPEDLAGWTLGLGVRPTGLSAGRSMKWPVWGASVCVMRGVCPCGWCKFRFGEGGRGWGDVQRIWRRGELLLVGGQVRYIL
ncbi:hypothetical protein BU26DRAFT_39840 [Trematosphaeria pertusa]|uniref:Uncharacterized protein n=1 Tax=Trematosphaeria pertusa TaxID=390896 RepID=A0A6A6J349_9PLEO|nr:uncharacterized protein BU26DRAFT_39840 [Trematosphaeria pertusa]KAF2257265.1 hypothetical protein BU26DRAFT_39840 [Trematosphaeria pertusa]